MIKPNLNLKNLYEVDEHLWLKETITLLKSKQFGQLDLDNLIEELEPTFSRLMWKKNNFIALRIQGADI